MAVNCRVLPTAIEGFGGPTAIETRAGVIITVRGVEPLTLPEVAVMVVLPAATPVASPLVVIVALLVSEEVHVAELVRSCVLESL